MTRETRAATSDGEDRACRPHTTVLFWVAALAATALPGLLVFNPFAGPPSAPSDPAAAPPDAPPFPPPETLARARPPMPPLPGGFLGPHTAALCKCS